MNYAVYLATEQDHFPWILYSRNLSAGEAAAIARDLNSLGHLVYIDETAGVLQ
jgi:hypothetical protein